MYPHFLANVVNYTIYVPRENIEARCEQYSTILTFVLLNYHNSTPHLTFLASCGKDKPQTPLSEHHADLTIVMRRVSPMG